MRTLSMKERVFYRFICNENRVYKHWYRRYLNAGVDLDRIRRVVSRVKTWYSWCSEWSKEGEFLEELATRALTNDDRYSARMFFHEAAGCYHVGQHFFYIDPEQKEQAENSLRRNYENAISIYEEPDRPIRLEIPFRGVSLPGYLRLANRPDAPLIIFISGMDNLKEIELHHYGSLFRDAGFNTFSFDGPGQGEVWNQMKFISDFETAVSAIIDWWEKHNSYDIDLQRIATVGWSLGGYLSPRAAAFDKRIKCAVGSGGPAHLCDLTSKMKVNPILLSGIPHLAGAEDYYEALKLIDIDIMTAPPLEQPLLIFHSGNDKLIPNGREHADTFIEWAVGEKELKFYPDGYHVCANYLDETDSYMIDWLRGHL